MGKPDRTLFRRGVESRDVAVMMEAFADGAVLHSPITFKPFEGKEAIARLLGILKQVFQDFRYTDELTAEDGTKALVFRTRVGDRDVEGLDLIRFDDTGRIRDFTVMVRPRSAVEALLKEVSSRLMAA
jgi:SnoaL-like protein